MKITAAMAADLGILTAALDQPGTGVAQSLRQLAADATAAIPTYLGLSVTVDGSDPPFRFTTLSDGVVPGDVRTSLGLALPGLGDARLLPVVVLVLYAGSPGTFVDLAADLAWLTGPPLPGRAPGHTFSRRQSSIRPLGYSSARATPPSKPIDNSVPRLLTQVSVGTPPACVSSPS